MSFQDYYPFGMVIPGRNSSIYRFGFNGQEQDNEVKGKGNSYGFEARMYDTRLGHWLSCDPLAAKYPDLSPFNFVANNPIMFVDPDGRKIILSQAFKKTSYKPVLDNLRANNATFIKILGKYETDREGTAFNLTMAINESVIPQEAVAWTDYTFSFNKANPKVATGAIGRIDFRKSYAVNYNNLGKATLIIHEALHAHLGLQAISTPNTDKTHNTWDNYLNLMQQAVREYSEDNKLNLDESQIYELSIMNAGPGSSVYDNYLNGLAKDNNTSYEQERSAFIERMNALVGKDADPKQ